MRWLNALERRFGYLAFPGLIRIVVVFNLLVFLLLTMKPGFVDMLTLQPDKVRTGEVWRLFSYVFIPSVGIGKEYSILWMFVYLNFLWLVGEGLEQAWGSFKLNLFYLVGLIGTAVAAFAFGVVDVTGTYLNLSLFLAFATLFPNFPILLFFILPVRVKWLALLGLVGVTLNLLNGSNAERLAVVVSLSNYLLFFGGSWVRQWSEQGKVAVRQQQFQLAQHSEEDETLHQCKVCARTELSSPDLEFRVASDGEEYCLAHLPSRQTQVPPPLPSTAPEPPPTLSEGA
jgi:hypothetical protein